VDQSDAQRRTIAALDEYLSEINDLFDFYTPAHNNTEAFPTNTFPIAKYQMFTLVASVHYIAVMPTFTLATSSGQQRVPSARSLLLTRKYHVHLNFSLFS